MSLCGLERFRSLQNLLLAVIAVGVGAAAVAVVDGAGGGHVQSAEVVVAGALAVELAGAEVDVGGAVAVHPRLGLEAVGAGIAGVEGNRLEEAEHGGKCVYVVISLSLKKDLQRELAGNIEISKKVTRSLFGGHGSVNPTDGGLFVLLLVLHPPPHHFFL